LKKEIESVKSELDLLKNLGFNIVRLLISWKAIEAQFSQRFDRDDLLFSDL